MGSTSRVLQRVYFPTGVSFDGSRFETAETGPVFSYLRDFDAKREELVARAGFEPVLPARESGLLRTAALAVEGRIGCLLWPTKATLSPR